MTDCLPFLARQNKREYNDCIKYICSCRELKRLKMCREYLIGRGAFLEEFLRRRSDKPSFGTRS
jgi:hypothetical protein